MKHLKKYENISTQNDPKPGDYILAGNYYYPRDLNWENYIKSNIGILINKTMNNTFNTKYILTNEIIENNLNDATDLIEIDAINKEKYIIMKFNKEKISNFSPNKKDMEIILAQNKYNL